MYGVRSDDLALLCDWDGDGADEAVVYRAGIWYVRDGLASGVTAHTFVFGTRAETPLCGNIDADRADEPMLFAPGGTWTMRSGFGASDPVAWTARYGVLSGDKPVVGDWDGNGKDDAGIYRNGRWYLRSSAEVQGSIVASFAYGTSIDVPVAGSWTSARSGLGVFRRKS